METTQHNEGPVAKAIEEQTSKLPLDVFLWASLGSIGTALTLKLMGRKEDALFVGQWAAPLLLFGLYNKLVKLEGMIRKIKWINNQVQFIQSSKKDCW